MRRGLSVKQLRYGLERLNNQDRGLTANGQHVTGWYVDEEKNVVVLELEEDHD